MSGWRDRTRTWTRWQDLESVADLAAPALGQVWVDQVTHHLDLFTVDRAAQRSDLVSVDPADREPDLGFPKDPGDRVLNREWVAPAADLADQEADIQVEEAIQAVAVFQEEEASATAAAEWDLGEEEVVVEWVPAVLVKAADDGALEKPNDISSKVRDACT